MTSAGPGEGALYGLFVGDSLLRVRYLGQREQHKGLGKYRQKVTVYSYEEVREGLPDRAFETDNGPPDHTWEDWLIVAAACDFLGLSLKPHWLEQWPVYEEAFMKVAELVHNFPLDDLDVRNLGWPLKTSGGFLRSLHWKLSFEQVSALGRMLQRR